MKRFFFTLATLVVLPLGSAVGCNAILGNAGGILDGDGGLFDSSPDDDTGPCGSGSKLCANTCLSTTDPANGCSGTCSACSAPTNGQSACNGANGSCGLGSCNTGFADCDKNASDGCESLLTSKTACGSCDNNCVAQGKAFCSPDPGGGLDCSDTCNGTDCCGNAECTNPNDPGGDCVDLQKNLNNCGSCGNGCPPIAHASVSCNSGHCAYVCDIGSQDCGNGVCAPLSGDQCGCIGQDCNSLSPGMWSCSSGGTCQCSDKPTCSAGGTDCCSGANCCGSAGSLTCTAEDNNACGSTCEKCINGASCDTGMHQCACPVGVACPGALGTTCCQPGNYCDAGTCTAMSGQCPSPSSCSLGGDAGTGCCHSPATFCETPSNSIIGCGSSCANCGTANQCCCADAGADSTGWACAPKQSVDGGVATCPAGCNP